MPKLNLQELRSADELHQEDLEDTQYRNEWEHTAIARTVSELICNYRAEHNMTQSQLAKQLGLRQPHISRMEAGDHNPNIETLAKLAEALNVEFTVNIAPTTHTAHPALTRKATKNIIGRSIFGQSEILISSI